MSIILLSHEAQAFYCYYFWSSFVHHYLPWQFPIFLNHAAYLDKTTHTIQRVFKVPECTVSPQLRWVNFRIFDWRKVYRPLFKIFNLHVNAVFCDCSLKSSGCRTLFRSLCPRYSTWNNSLGPNEIRLLDQKAY